MTIADASARPVPSLSLVVAALGLTQIIGYGTAYYSFSILAAPMARDLGVSETFIFGTVSAALVVSGLGAALVGRLADRIGGARVMALGSLSLAATFLALAAAPNGWTFALGNALLQIAASLSLYAVAFSALVQIAPEQSGRRITHLTLIAGFASTLFWPFIEALVPHLTWRQIFVGFGLANLLICAPVHVWLAALPRADASPRMDGTDRVIAPELPVERRRLGFVLMAVGFSLSGFLMSGLLTQMVPMLKALGLGAVAVSVGMLFGPAQFLVRLVNLVAGANRHPLAITLMSAAFLPIGTLILALTAPNLAGAALAVTLYAFGSGLKSIVQGTLPLALFGSAGFATLTGRMLRIVYVCGAIAPVIIARLVELFGPWNGLYVLTGVGASALIAFLWLDRLRRAPDSPQAT